MGLKHIFFVSLVMEINRSPGPQNRIDAYSAAVKLIFHSISFTFDFRVLIYSSFININCAAVGSCRSANDALTDAPLNVLVV